MAMALTEEKRQAIIRAGKHYGAAYLLMTIAMDHIDSGDVEIGRIGMNRNSIKMNGSRVQKSFDIFCQDFNKYLGKGDGDVVLRDFEQLKPEIDKILDLNL